MTTTRETALEILNEPDVERRRQMFVGLTGSANDNMTAYDLANSLEGPEGVQWLEHLADAYGTVEADGHLRGERMGEYHHALLR
ncbi:unnamed protein product, partial [marine sediment metagenome]